MKCSYVPVACSYGAIAHKQDLKCYGIEPILPLGSVFSKCNPIVCIYEHGAHDMIRLSQSDAWFCSLMSAVDKAELIAASAGEE